LPLLGECVVGTSSPRRSSSVLALRSDLKVQDIRGNVETRARKVAEGQYDATILAAAGLQRLGLATPSLERAELPVELFTPAPGQGALSAQCRNDDEATKAILATIHDVSTADCVNAERRLLWLLGGGCSMPLGALVEPDPAHGYRMLVSLFSESQPSCGTTMLLHGDNPALLADQAAAQLQPFLNDPLAGQKVVLLRPGGAGSRLSNSLCLAGAEVESVAVSETFPISLTDGALPTGSPGVVAFSSARAVDRFFEEVSVRDLDLAHTQFFAVGPTTALAVQDRGYSCRTPTPCAGGRELARYLLDETSQDDVVLYPCAEDRHPDFESELKTGGRQVHAVTVYRTEVMSGIEIPTADHLVFTSPSAVRAFAGSSASRSDSNLLAFGQTTASAMQDAGLSPFATSTAPTAQALVSLIQGLSSDAPTPQTTTDPGDS
ncbi:MAG: uroporphyrinogen-III synthase, partial [Planctomycetota bacterium]|nr:uroporphyrinogen-III synthase [Planctomycetota bacterium]